MSTLENRGAVDVVYRTAVTEEGEPAGEADEIGLGCMAVGFVAIRAEKKDAGRALRLVRGSARLQPSAMRQVKQRHTSVIASQREVVADEDDTLSSDK